MFTPDRTVKLMLGAIIILLTAILADRIVTSTARADATTSSSSNLIEAAWTTETVSSIKIGTKDRIKSIFTLDQANSVVVQYEDRIDIYRMRPVYIDPSKVTLKRTTTGTQTIPEITR